MSKIIGPQYAPKCPRCNTYPPMPNGSICHSCERELRQNEQRRQSAEQDRRRDQRRMEEQARQQSYQQDLRQKLHQAQTQVQQTYQQPTYGGGYQDPFEGLDPNFWGQSQQQAGCLQLLIGCGLIIGGLWFVLAVGPSLLSFLFAAVALIFSVGLTVLFWGGLIVGALWLIVTICNAINNGDNGSKN